MSTPEKRIPEEDELVTALNAIKLSHPDYGVKRILTTLGEDQPAWSVSEKRLKKVLQAQGLMNRADAPAANATSANEPEPEKSGVEDDPSIPVSFIDPKLDLKSVSTSIVVCMKKKKKENGETRERGLKRVVGQDD